MFLYVNNRFNSKPTIVLTRPTPLPEGASLVPYLDAPGFLLPDSTEKLKALRKGKYWRKRSWEERTLAELYGPVTFALLTDAESLKKWLPRVKALFRARWANEYSGSDWMSDEGFEPYSDAMLALAEEGLASLAIYYFDDTEELLAYGYNLDNGTTRHFYQHAASTAANYRKYGIGQLFLDKLLLLSVEQGYTFFDFMVGHAEYKARWATSVQRTWQIIDSRQYSSALSYWKAVLVARARYMLQDATSARRMLKKVFMRG